jgi:hypothetical protein
VQDTVTATGALLRPDTLVSRAAETCGVYSGIDMSVRPEVGYKVHTHTAGDGDYGIIFRLPVIQAVNIFLVALAHQGAFLDINRASLFLGANTKQGGEQLHLSFSAGGTDGYTTTASKHQDLLVVPGHLNYFS